MKVDAILWTAFTNKRFDWRLKQGLKTTNLLLPSAVCEFYHRNVKTIIVGHNSATNFKSFPFDVWSQNIKCAIAIQLTWF